MSEIGERAEKIWRENSETIRRKRKSIRLDRNLIEALKKQETEHYADLILKVFGASKGPAYVSVVIVSYDSCSRRLKCRMRFFDDIDVETDNCIHCLANNKKVMEAMNNVNACAAEDCTIITRIYNLLVADSQVTKYFEVTSDEDSKIVIKMRPEEDVKLKETICENEESEE